MSHIEAGMYAEIEAEETIEKQHPDSNSGPSVPPTESNDQQRAVQRRSAEPSSVDSRNYLLHQYLIRQDLAACRALVKEQIDEFKEHSENALLMKAVVLREEGDIRQSLNILEQCAAVSPHSIVYQKQIARSHFLLGNHAKAISVFDKVDEMNGQRCDPQVIYWRALCLYHSNNVNAARECLAECPLEKSTVDCLVLLGKIYTEMNQVLAAIEVFKKALELEPENVEVLTSLGLLYLRAQSEERAFEMLGRALSYDLSHVPAIIAAASIIQTFGDFDVALSKYRIAAEKCGDSGQLWNNIGMCFFGKGKLVAAISCLKRANYLHPLDWKILYNLGIVHNAMQQFASAYHFLSAAINVHNKSPILFMAIAVVLTNLEDAENARKAYEKALALEPNNAQIVLNMAIFEYKYGKRPEEAIARIDHFERLASAIVIDQEMRTTAEKLKAALRHQTEDRETVHGEEEETHPYRHRQRDKQDQEEEDTKETNEFE